MTPPMSPTALERKARGYLTDGRLRVLSADGRAVVAEVTARSGDWRQIWDRVGVWCTCPAGGGCSHLEALQLISDGPREETAMAYRPDDPARPFGEGEEEGDGDGPSPGEAPVGLAAGLAEVDRALLPLRDAPVTYQTLRAIASTEFVPGPLRGRPEAVLAAVLYGRELGLGPMEALAHIDVIDGRPSPSAELLTRLIRAAGHRIEPIEATAERCTLRGTRSDTGEVLEVTFTIDDAARITTKERGAVIALSETKRWREYPADMLWARAITRLWRRLFPDVARAASSEARPTGSGPRGAEASQRDAVRAGHLWTYEEGGDDA